MYSLSGQAQQESASAPIELDDIDQKKFRFAAESGRS